MSALSLTDSHRLYVPIDPLTRQQPGDAQAFYFLRFGTSPSLSQIMRCAVDALHERLLSLYEASPDDVTDQDLTEQRRLTQAKQFRTAEPRAWAKLSQEPERVAERAAVLDKIARLVAERLAADPKLAMDVELRQLEREE